MLGLLGKSPLHVSPLQDFLALDFTILDHSEILEDMSFPLSRWVPRSHNFSEHFSSIFLLCIKVLKPRVGEPSVVFTFWCLTSCLVCSCSFPAKHLFHRRYLKRETGQAVEQAVRKRKVSVFVRHLCLYVVVFVVATSALSQNPFTFSHTFLFSSENSNEYCPQVEKASIKEGKHEWEYFLLCFPASHLPRAPFRTSSFPRGDHITNPALIFPRLIFSNPLEALLAYAFIFLRLYCLEKWYFDPEEVTFFRHMNMY